jgi:penicillin-binding protein 1A
MNGIKSSLQVRPFVPPKNIVFVRINKNTGLLTKPEDPDSYFEAFRKGTEPKEYTPIESSQKTLRQSTEKVED